MTPIPASEWKAQVDKGKSEYQTHTEIVQYLRHVLPAGYRVECNLNNPRSARNGAHLKALGLNAGRPDIEIIGPGGSVACIEIKTHKGRLSAAQKAYQEWCLDWMVPHCVARGIGDVQAFLLDIGVPVRGAS